MKTRYIGNVGSPQCELLRGFRKLVADLCILVAVLLSGCTHDPESSDSSIRGITQQPKSSDSSTLVKDASIQAPKSSDSSTLARDASIQAPISSDSSTLAKDASIQAPIFSDSSTLAKDASIQAPISSDSSTSATDAASSGVDSKDSSVHSADSGEKRRRLRYVTNNGMKGGPGRIIKEGRYMYCANGGTPEGSIVYRSSDDGDTWTPISEPGINGDPANVTTTSLVWFKGKLYAGTWAENGGGVARLFRANADAENPSTITWEPITTDGFGNANNAGFTDAREFDGYLYVGCYNLAEGSEVWRSTTGNPGSFSMCITKSWGREDNSDTTVLYVYNNKLYAGTEMVRGLPTSWNGTALYSTGGGSGTLTWTQENPNGYGDISNTNTGSGGLVVFKGYMYAGTWNGFGMQVWRTSMTGTPWSWTKVVSDGGDSADNDVCQSLVVLDDRIYYGSVGTYFSDPQTGRFYTSTDGITWTRIAQTGFLEAPMAGIIGMSVANDKIYISVMTGSGSSAPGQEWVYE